MLLYHYTRLEAARQIVREGQINPTSEDHEYAAGLVCLTGDLDSVGHGLPDGRELPADHPTKLATIWRDGRRLCLDHTECRAHVQFASDDPNFLSWEDIHPSPEDLLALNLSGYSPLGGRLSDEELLSIALDMRAGVIKPKATTWWYYKGPLPLDRIEGFEVRDAHGAYVLRDARDL